MRAKNCAHPEVDKTRSYSALNTANVGHMELQRILVLRNGNTLGTTILYIREWNGHKRDGTPHLQPTPTHYLGVGFKPPQGKKKRTEARERKMRAKSSAHPEVI